MLDAFVRAEVDRLVMELGAARLLTVVPSHFPGLPLPAPVCDSDEELPADQVLLAVAAAAVRSPSGLRRGSDPARDGQDQRAEGRGRQTHARQHEQEG